MNEENFSWFWNFFKDYGWAIEATVILLLTLGAVYLESFLYKKLKPKLEAKNKVWELAILNSIHKPLCTLFWFLGITFSIQILEIYVPKDFHVLDLVPHLRKIGVVFIGFWFFIRFIKEIELLLLMSQNPKRRLDKTTIRGIGQVMRVTVIVGSVFIVMQSIFGIGASAIVAFAGGSGITIGWAAKDMLANFFGGLMLFLDRPFVIGDRITFTEKDIDGVVENIGWRLTRVRTLDKVPLYIPNSLFSSITMTNPSRMSHRRIRNFIGIRYEDAEKMSAIVKDVLAFLKSNKDIDQNEVLLVNFANFGPSSLEFLVHCFTREVDYTNYIAIQEQVFFKIIEIIKNHDAQMAYPTTTIHFGNEKELVSK